MRAGADEIEIGKMIVAVMRAEIGALGQQRLQAEGATKMRAEIAFEIGRAVVEHGIKAFAQIRDEQLLHAV